MVCALKCDETFCSFTINKQAGKEGEVANTFYEVSMQCNDSEPKTVTCDATETSEFKVIVFNKEVPQKKPLLVEEAHEHNKA